MITTLPEQRITLLDIARKLGVSNATVSLSLNGHPRISSATRKKVVEMAEQMGYRPDPMLSALAKHRSKRRGKDIIHSEIAWICDTDDNAVSSSDHEMALCSEAAIAAAERSGYRLERYLINSELGYQRLDQILRARGVQGILLPPLKEGDHWQQFPWENYAVVRYGNDPLGLPGHRVSPDHVENMKHVFQKLRDRGYEKIGYLTGFNPAVTPRSGVELREAGYLMAQKRFPEIPPIPVFNPLAVDEGSPHGRLSEWMGNYRPQVIISEDPQLAERLVCEGWDPRSVGIVHTSVDASGHQTGMCWNLDDIGHIGFQLLDNQIKIGHRGPPAIAQNVLIKGRWVDGATLPSRPPTLLRLQPGHLSIPGPAPADR